MGKWSRFLIFLVLAAVLIFLDWYVKAYILENIPLARESSSLYPYGGIPVFKDFLGLEFSICQTHNTGAAWGMFRDYTMVLLILRCAFVAGLFIYLVFFNKDKTYEFPLVLVLAGAIGNIVDFMSYGYVVDMFHVIIWTYDYPVFNLADSYIFIGMAWVILQTFFYKKSEKAS